MAAADSASLHPMAATDLLACEEVAASHRAAVQRLTERADASGGWEERLGAALRRRRLRREQGNRLIWRR